MVFSSSVFLFVFLPCVMLIYFCPIFSRISYKNLILLFFSLIFYAYGEPLFVFLMVLSIFITWFMGYAVNKYGKICLFLGIVYYLGILFVFKYANFFIENINNMATMCNIQKLNVTLPIGISFFTFQMMSYIFDVYYKKVPYENNILRLGLYISLFPQLVAGPIIKYADICSQFVSRNITWEKFSNGFRRFICGLGKKILVADYLACIADMAFDGNMKPSLLLYWMGAVAYTLQIYYDFSGYSDMAIGLGEMFGFKIPENFNYPYISKSMTEFWRRWHISLSSWFKEYVYIPLGGSRVGRQRLFFNLLCVWLLTGLWHGANWTFVFWGGIHFSSLVIEKYTNFLDKLHLFRWPYVMLVVMFAWVVFRAENISEGAEYIVGLLYMKDEAFYTTEAVQYLFSTQYLLLIAFLGVTPIVKNIFDYLRNKKMEYIESFSMLVIFLLVIVNVVANTYSPFIYFNF